MYQIIPGRQWDGHSFYNNQQAVRLQNTAIKTMCMLDSCESRHEVTLQIEPIWQKYYSKLIVRRYINQKTTYFITKPLAATVIIAVLVCVHILCILNQLWYISNLLIFSCVYKHENSINQYSLQTSQDEKDQLIQNNSQEIYQDIGDTKQPRITKLNMAMITTTSIYVLGFIGLMIYAAIVIANQQLCFIFGDVSDGIEYLIICGCALAASIPSVLLLFAIYKQKQILRIQSYQVICIVFETVLLVVCVVAVSLSHSKNWGPLIEPRGNGASITWWTQRKQISSLCVDGKLYYQSSDQSTKIAGNCQYVPTYKTNNHNLLIPSVQFIFQLFDDNFTFSNVVKEDISFFVTSDILSSRQYLQKSLEGTQQYDIHVSAGDTIQHFSNKDMFKLLSNPDQLKFLQAVGEQDAKSALQEFNYLQQVHGVCFYFVSAFDEHSQMTTASIEIAIQFLEREIYSCSGIKFIVSHQPVYSTGEHGANPQFSIAMQSFLDRHEDSNIMAVFGGRDHVFSSYQKDGVYFFNTGSSGSRLTNVFETSEMQNRTWKANRLDGPQPSDQHLNFGGEFHLLSLLQHTRVEVNVSKSGVGYVIKNIETGKVESTFAQEIKKPRFWGPIVSPYENGANITWWTRDPVKTSVCIDGKLYYGTNNMHETQTLEDCSLEPAVEKLYFHSIFVDRQLFDAVVEGKEIHFDNRPKDSVKFIITSDAHEMTPIIRRSIQNMEDFDFHICGGDQTYWSTAIEYDLAFPNWHQKPFCQCQGNHEAYATRRPVKQRDTTFHQQINGVHFFSVFIFNESDIAAVDDTLVNQSITWLDENIQLYTGTKFILVHHPMYSTGEFGSYPLFTTQLEIILDKYDILAVITGHDHIFSSYKRKNVLILVAGSGGGPLDKVNDSSVMEDRIWNADQLLGPLPFSPNDKSMGANYHLYSFCGYTRTEVELTKSVVTYLIRDLLSWEVIAEYKQDR
ncbi:Alkaline_phosphatase [Hexamita inflata]|uniref:Alkaline phosphatase n=1 Tax=Hexamita inflata TaxID=28002 RepID=A0AA86VHB2_9EUKA|nr:Alkaline phosphatase [Hexamita inflata]